MSHEIRTPLNGVLGMAQAMEAGELSDEQRDRLAVIRQSGESLLSILNDVLDLSKVEAGKLELEEVEFDIGDLARGAHAAFTAIAQEKGLRFDLTISPQAKGVYRGDSTRIRQILYNLISNALKFTERGDVYVRVHRRDGKLLLTVSDSGIGIPAAQLEGLFNKFVQADASTTRRFGGTGLGLAICRELATLMGGTIEASSQQGEGATFQVSLPLPRLEPGAKATAPSLAAGAPVEFDDRPLRILAAEDNPVNQAVLSAILQQIGVVPHIVDNGALAVDAWAAGDWDLILMDVQMPEMDGPTASRAIRAREAAEGRTRVPIIALTANVMSHQISDYLAAGMDAFVAKPIEISRLFTAIEDALMGVGYDTPMAANA
jgi:CheY-like chemotaxis protein